MARDSDGDSMPLLVLDRVDHDPEVPTRRIGALRLAGHPLRVVLDVGRPDQVVYVEVPELLAVHEPSQRAVVAAMSRIESGEALPLPYDLTGEIRDAEPPFPLRPLDADEQARLDAAAGGVDLRVRRVRRSGQAPQLVQADLVLDGHPISIEVRLYAQPGAVPAMSWLAGPDPAGLTPAQRYAIQRALLAAR
jgi:hypothetical protein